MPIALAISGSDPTGGAGLQADLQVFRHFGCHGTGILTALTIQDSSRVHRVLPVFPSVVLEQLRTLLADISPQAVKIGMLATDDVVRNVILGLARLEDDVPVVIDPVLRASDGSLLLERRAWDALIGLFPRAALLTPNLPEAEELTGQDVSGPTGCERAARVLIEDLGARAVLLKGGHGDGTPRDLLAVRGETGIEQRWFESERLGEPGRSVHGTGCALSSAIAAGLARGQSLAEAVEAARLFVREGIRNAQTLGGGAAFLTYPQAS
jgi:hydroxymethylpyrimidine/phosphomethylpyrimidine kinase